MRLALLARFAVLAVVLCAVGCNSNNKGKIEGTKWTSQAMTVQGKQLFAGTAKLEFGADKKLTYIVGADTYTGTYSLSYGDYVTLHFDQVLEGSKTHRQRIIIQGDTLKLIDTDGFTVTFSRVR
jgi:uncharacterized lipoprotein NlpE involved in copper resistance